jgi:hypothetical protein
MTAQWSGFVGVYEGEGLLTLESTGICIDAVGAPTGNVTITPGQYEIAA